jgi:hypothetical protein
MRLLLSNPNAQWVITQEAPGETCNIRVGVNSKRRWGDFLVG